jgi:hypothetical protein
VKAKIGYSIPSFLQISVFIIGVIIYLTFLLYK